MEFSGTQTLPVSREEVWAYLLDVNKVAACAPGFENIVELANEHWKAVVGAAIGPIKAKFTMDVTRTNMVEPERMVVRGQGNAPGSRVEVAAEMRLTAPTPDTTRLEWTATLDLSGTLARAGSFMIKGTVEKLSGQFFDCLKKSISAKYGRW